MIQARSFILAPLLLLILTGSGLTRDIHVPSDVATLSMALKQAGRGDTIILAPGQYYASDIDLPDRVAVVGAAEDPSGVVIYGEGHKRLFRAEGLERFDFAGVTLTGGGATGATVYDASGGALLVSNSTIGLERVHVLGNTAQSGGGGVQVTYGELIASDCVFADNHAAKGGGAVAIGYESQAVFERTSFAANTAAWGGALSVRTASNCQLIACTLTGNLTPSAQQLGGALFADYSATGLFADCVFAENSARLGGAARLNGVLTNFVNCTVNANSASESGGAFQTRDSELNLLRTIVSFNVGAALASETTAVNCGATVVYGNLGGDWIGDLGPLRDQGGNLEVDPLYCDAADYHLQDDSPCAPANNPYGLIGALPVGCTDVSITLQSFTATRQHQEIDLVWTVAGPPHEFHLQGRPEADPAAEPWIVPYEASPIPGRYLAKDKPNTGGEAVYYRLDARTAGGEWFLLGELVVEAVPDEWAPGLQMGRIFPNPFNPQVNIQFELGKPSRVFAAVYDINGRLVVVLAQGDRPAGHHALSWDSRDSAGRVQPTGTYLLRITNGETQQTSKLLLIK